MPRLHSNRDIMLKHIYISFLLALLFCVSMSAQDRQPGDTTVKSILLDITVASTDDSSKDTLPHILPFLLPKELFIPSDMLFGYTPWTSAPITRPKVLYTPKFGFNGSIGFGE